MSARGELSGCTWVALDASLGVSARVCACSSVDKNSQIPHTFSRRRKASRVSARFSTFLVARHLKTVRTTRFVRSHDCGRVPFSGAAVRSRGRAPSAHPIRRSLMPQRMAQARACHVLRSYPSRLHFRPFRTPAVSAAVMAIPDDARRTVVWRREYLDATREICDVQVAALGDRQPFGRIEASVSMAV